VLRSGEASRSGGFALLVVLWSLGILALFGVLLTSSARMQMGVATAVRDHAVAEAAAEGAIRRAMFVLLDGGQIGTTSQPIRVRIGDATVDIIGENEAGMINPNTDSIQVLRGLLAAVGLDQPRAALLAGEIVDWRLRGRISVLGGVKLDQYRDHGLPYQSGNRPFNSLDEIGLLPDMTPEILARLRPWLSIYQEGDVQASGGASPVGSAIVDARLSGPGFVGPGFVSHDVIMRVTATALVPGRARFVRSAVVRLRASLGGDGPLMQILTWE
jgi:general secretion pathway protein K